MLKRSSVEKETLRSQSRGPSDLGETSLPLQEAVLLRFIKFNPLCIPHGETYHILEQGPKTGQGILLFFNEVKKESGQEFVLLPIWADVESKCLLFFWLRYPLRPSALRSKSLLYTPWTQDSPQFPSTS